MKVPFNKPFIFGQELVNIAKAVLNNCVLAGDGEYTHSCQKWIEKALGSRKALLTHSCTGALEMAAILIDAGPGDEIIMPSFTFVSTANAFVLRGAVPVFVDIRADTLNIDEQRIEAAITDKTKGIVPVHYAGVACDMRQINTIAERHGLFVVEDAAQALLSKSEDGYLGALGHLGCLSFHETKNIISGEGGALLINDDRFLERSEIVWQKGTNRKKFDRGEVGKYSWVDIGSSFLPSELTAAFLCAQMEYAQTIIDKRKVLCEAYVDKLHPLVAQGCFRFGQTTPGNGHIFSILANSMEERRAILNFLISRQVHAVSHYVPLHSSPAGRRCSRVAGSMEVTDAVSSCLIRLPLYYGMTDEEHSFVVKTLFDYCNSQYS